MGTRADFYIGKGKKAEWLGSIAWDGYPDGVPDTVKKAKTKAEFIKAVDEFLQAREDATFPKDGWPWPWKDSCTTDYAYSYDQDQVWACPFGHGWFDATQKEPEDLPDTKTASFPDMTKIQNVSFGKNSGVMVLAAKR